MFSEMLIRNYSGMTKRWKFFELTVVVLGFEMSYKQKALQKLQGSPL